MFTRKINELVSEDSVFAWVLHFFGVSFYKYSDLTLEEVCKSNQIDQNLFVNQIENYIIHGEDHETLAHKIDEYPIDLIIEYLKHSHHKFVKQRLPYISQLVNALDETNFINNPEIRDLKFIFPTFVKDFIEHIYEEEDELFAYINWANKVIKGKTKASNFEMTRKINQNSLQEHALEHDRHESGMEGISKMTNSYSSNSKDLLVEVIYSELKNLESDLVKHAKIENQVFFPKALHIERSLIKLTNSQINFN